jgi:hypothetical protein
MFNNWEYTISYDGEKYLYVWYVDVHNENHMHYNKYLSSLV